MTKDEALKMAINTMEIWNGKNVKTNTASFKINFEGAINACKKALKQPEGKEFFERGKEIAQWADKQAQLGDAASFSNGFNSARQLGYAPSYTHPHQWQGLTDDEIVMLGYESQGDECKAIKLAEQALKGKNT